MKNILIVEDKRIGRLSGRSFKSINPDFNILAKLASVKETVKWLTVTKQI